jgi:hypothetical protein
MSHKDRKTKADSITAADFPALRSFLRGYFHEDVADEYGSLEEAVRQFCEDAEPDERRRVANEWVRFVAQTKGWPLEAINRDLIAQLGSANRLSPADLEMISRTFREFDRG